MKIWIAILMTGLCVAVYLLSSTADRSAIPAAKTPASPAAKLVVRASASNHTTWQPQPLSTVAAAPAAPGAATAGDGMDPAPRKPAPSRAEVHDGFEAFFQAEARDVSWSQLTSEALNRGIQAVLPARSRLQSLECRGTLCRIEASHADLEDYRTYMRGAFHNPDSRVTRTARYTAMIGDPASGKPIVSVAFIAREGKQLPDLDALLGR